MSWVAIIWITGCLGLKCDPAVVSVIEQPNEESCARVIKTWKGISDKHRGACILGDPDRLNVIVKDTEAAL